MIEDIDEITSQLAEECGGKTLHSSLSSDSRYIYPFECGVIDIPYGGGIHSGKIYEIFGEESHGKCLTKDTYLLTPEGLITLGELITKKAGKTLCEEEIDYQVDNFIINENGDDELSNVITCNGIKKVLKITTKSGNIIKCTENHPLRVLNEFGVIVWKKACEMIKGDYLVSFLKESDDDREISVELFHSMRFLGYMLADGSYNSSRKRVQFSNSNVEVIDNFNESLNFLFGVTSKSYKKSNTSISHFVSVSCLDHFYEKYGFKRALAVTKSIPYEIRMLPLEAKRVFLRSYMDLESYFSVASKTIEVTSASFQLIHQLKLILQQEFGIFSNIATKKVKLKLWDTHRNYFRLIMSGDDVKKYIDFIGYDLEEKNNLIESCELNFLKRFNCSIPNTKFLLKNLYNSLKIKNRASYYAFRDYMVGYAFKSNLTERAFNKITDFCDSSSEEYKRIRELFKNKFYDKIVDIVEIGLEPTFDIAVPGTNSFIANGILSHNTTVALEFTKAMSKYFDALGDKNYAVLWIESESALDRQRAMHIGCKLEKFIFEEAETVEDAREFMVRYLNRCIDKKLRLMIVWDTLAAASTNNELNAVITESDKEKYAGGMMEKPRLVSALLRTLTNLLGKTDSTLVLVNQVRLKPGQYVSTLEPPGGKSVRFHASVRSYIKKAGEIYSVLPNKDKRMVAIESELLHVKNKLTSPKQSSTLYINTESGFNQLETTIRFLKTIDGSPISVKGGGYCTFSMPEGVAKVDAGEVVLQKNVEVTFQKAEKVLTLKETYPHIVDWLDYLVYEYYSNTTVLVKIMIIDKLWFYEEMFFGEKRTELDEHEMNLYLSRKKSDLVTKPVKKPIKEDEESSMKKSKKKSKK